MLSIKFVIETVVEQGRRVIQLAARPKIKNIENCRILKLSELSTNETGGTVGNSLVRHHQSDIATSCSASSVSLVSSGGGGFFKFLRPATSRLFQGFVRKVPTPLWAEARKKSAKRLFGETAPYFALVGITLVSGPERGLLTAQDELEALCGDIREAISRAGWIHNPRYWSQCSDILEKEKVTDTNVPGHGYSLMDFELGSVIDKGCNAVVYAAKWSKEDVSERRNCSAECVAKDTNVSCHSANLSGSDQLVLDQFNSNLSNVHANTAEDVFDICKDSMNITEENERYDGAIDSYQNDSVSISSTLSYAEVLNLQRLDFSGNMSSQKIHQDAADTNILLTTKESEVPCKRKKVKFKDVLSKDLEDDVMKNLPCTFKKDKQFGISNSGNDTCCSREYPIAVKMMFNYEAESNAPAILSAMYKEMIPARTLQLDDNLLLWKQRFLSSKVHLPPHANIVDMPCVFVDRIPLLEDGLNLYPDALPKRINPMGYGRNMSLFCVMKRYDCTLHEYINRYEPSIRTSLLLLAQLLEAVYHINKYGVVHRDLKSDNILLSLSDGVESPLLVLSDFGCCLTELSLSVPFLSYEADPRHGNTSLMAPEVKDATPGLLSYIRYSKADLWAVGTIAFEIFGIDNPFVPGKKIALDSSSYKESQIPKLPKSIPSTIRHLIYDMLRKNPNHRPTPLIAATVCQLFLWAPNKWLNRHALIYPSYSEVTRWLLCLSTKVLCEAGSALPSTVTSDPGSSTFVASCVSASSPEMVLQASNCHRENASGKASSGCGYLEYDIVSTFLSRVHYSDIVQAIKWCRTV